MHYRLWKTRMNHLIMHRNGYLILATGLLVLNIIQAGLLALTANHERVILVPPQVERPLWVTTNYASTEYLSGMSLFLSNLLLNVTPSTVKSQHELFLKYVDPKYYAALKTKLNAQAAKITKQHMILRFDRGDLKVDAKHQSVKLSGEVEYRVGNTLLSTHKLTSIMQFIWRDGKLWVESFEELKGDQHA